MSPPITITPGLKKLTEAASTSPSSRPAWRTSCIASGRPSRTWRTTSREFWAAMPSAAQPRRHRAAAGHRLQAAAVAAAADLLVAGHVDVADVARRALGAAVDPAVGDDPAADAGPDLDEQQMVVGAPGLPVLAQRHDVHVVVDERRCAEAIRQSVADPVAVPPGHDRRSDGGAGRELDGPGDADPDATHVGVRAADAAEQLVERPLQPGEHSLGTLGDRDLLRALDEHLAAEVGHRQARVRGAEVGGQHDAGVAVEREHLRRPAARGDAAAGGDDEAL